MTALKNQIGTADSPIHPLLSDRWSPRAFSARPVQAATLWRLFEAARWAPSSYNLQPWSFIVATREQPAQFDRLLGVLMPLNAKWARNAPVLVLAVGKKILDAGGRPNRFAMYDVGQAVANLILEATASGLVAHQMGGFNSEKAHEVFGLPRDYDPATVIALGYLGDIESLPETLQKMERAPRRRKPLSEFVFGGRWGETSPLVVMPASGEAADFVPPSSESTGPAGPVPAGFLQGGEHDQTDQIR